MHRPARARAPCARARASGWSDAGCRPARAARRPRCRRRRRSSRRGRRPARPRAARPRAACPRPRGAGPRASPVSWPSTTSKRVHSTCSMSRSAAIASTWNDSADDASTTVWPLRWCAATSARASGYDAAGELLLEQLAAELVDLVDRRARATSARGSTRPRRSRPGRARGRRRSPARARPPAARRRVGAAAPPGARSRRTRRSGCRRSRRTRRWSGRRDSGRPRRRACRPLPDVTERLVRSKCEPAAIGRDAVDDGVSRRA